MSLVSINMKAEDHLVDFAYNFTSQAKWVDQVGVDFSLTVLVLDLVTGGR